MTKQKKNRCASIQTAKLKVQRESKEFAKAAEMFYDLDEPESQKIKLARMREYAIKCNADWRTERSLCFSEYGLLEFMELVVQECAEIALKSAGVNYKSPLAVREAERICDKIKDHFGVK